MTERLTANRGGTGVSSTSYAPRVAGFSFLFLIVTVLVGDALWGGVSTTHGIADTLASVSENSAKLRLSVVLSAVAGITTLVLAAMLYAIVARHDRNLAILALLCRTVEAGLSAVTIFVTLALLELSQGSTRDTPSVHVLADLLVNVRWMDTNVGATFFAAGSTVYAYLLLRGRSIPVAMAGTGLVGSLLILVGVPWQTALGHSTFAGAGVLIWVPIGVFEITAGVWLMVRGAAVPATTVAEPAAARV